MFVTSQFADPAGLVTTEPRERLKADRSADIDRSRPVGNLDAVEHVRLAVSGSHNPEPASLIELRNGASQHLAARCQ
jgi:hypothetical protein